MNFRIKEKLMLWISGIKKNLFQPWRWKIWYFWTKKLMEIYLLITEKFLFWPFREWEIRSLFEPKSWWKDDIYWLLKSSCFELFGGGKYGIFLSQEVDGKMIFTGYREVLVLNFSVMGNTIFFSAKKLMEKWYLLGLFELSIIFQDLENTVFHAVSLVSPLKARSVISFKTHSSFSRGILV